MIKGAAEREPGGASGGGGGSSIADLSGDLSDGAVEKVVDDLFSDEVRFSDTDDEEEEEEELTSRSRGKGKGKANGTRNKRAAPSKLPGRKAASKKKKTKAAKEYGFLISDLERMRGRGGTALTTGIKGSGLGDLKVFAQRWLASKKKANHPLLAGTPMCDEVHEILGLPSPPQLTSI